MTTVDAFPEAHVDPALDLDRRYTTRETMALCMRLAGVDAFDLDVAADAESHWAPTWYGIEKDGLDQPWTGRVWCNCPYSNIAPWVSRAWRAMARRDAEVIAMLLPATRTDQHWWHDSVEPFRDGSGPRTGISLQTHFLPRRIKFGHPGNRDAVGVGSPPFGCVLLVWRHKEDDP